MIRMIRMIHMIRMIRILDQDKVIHGSKHIHTTRLRDSGVGLDDVQWASCMAQSRAIASPSGLMRLIPILDFANHR